MNLGTLGNALLITTAALLLPRPARVWVARSLGRTLRRLLRQSGKDSVPEGDSSLATLVGGVVAFGGLVALVAWLLAVILN